MGDRHQTDVANFFNVFVTLEYSSDPYEVKMLSKYPETYSEGFLDEIPDFAYPCSYDEPPGVEHYSFAFSDPMFKYGFCRMPERQKIIYCFLTDLPWFRIFYDLLDKVSAMNPTDLQSALHSIYETKVPKPTTPCTITWLNSDDNLEQKYDFETPDSEALPTIPKDINLTEFFSAFKNDAQIKLFVALVMERRIMIVSKRLSRLTACCHACAALLYPLTWQNIFIPILPQKNIEICCAPMPYIIGIHSSLIESAKREDSEQDAMIVDADLGTVTGPYENDKHMIPDDALDKLKSSLKSAEKNFTEGCNGVSHAFLRCLAYLLIGYEDGFAPDRQGNIIFDPDLFVQAPESNSQRKWRENIVKTQHFKQFVDEKARVYQETNEIPQGPLEKEMMTINVDRSKSKKAFNKGKRILDKGFKNAKVAGQKVQTVASSSAKKTSEVLKAATSSIKYKDYGITSNKNSSQKSNSNSKRINYLESGLTSARPLRRSGKGEIVRHTTPLSFGEDDIPNLSLANDPDIRRFMTQRLDEGDGGSSSLASSQSSGLNNLMETSNSNSMSSLTNNNSQTNLTMHNNEIGIKPPPPTRPPRRHKEQKKFPGTAPSADAPLLSLDDTPTVIMDTQVHTPSQNVHNDLLDLDLSPHVQPAANFAHTSTPSIWEVPHRDNQPNYSISQTERQNLVQLAENHKPEVPPPPRFSSTNPFCNSVPTPAIRPNHLSSGFNVSYHNTNNVTNTSMDNRNTYVFQSNTDLSTPNLLPQTPPMKPSRPPPPKANNQIDPFAELVDLRKAV